jgi:hypothetical protein
MRVIAPYATLISSLMTEGEVVGTLAHKRRAVPKAIKASLPNVRR